MMASRSASSIVATNKKTFGETTLCRIQAKGEKKMTRVIITAQVEDSANWENGFRTHGGLFKDMTVTAMHFTATDENEVAIHFEVDNADKYFELMEAPVTAEAMAFDGVKRETVKIFVLDKVFDL